MSLKEKYTVKHKKGIGRLFFLCSFFALWLSLYSTLARYETVSEGYARVQIADWKIALNGKMLKSGDNTLRDVIRMVPITHDDGTIRPGQEGYFDIEINPDGTEVSFAYRVALDLTKSLPNGLTISDYSINNDDERSPLPAGAVERTVNLGNRAMLTEGDIQRIRYYWSWESSGTDGVVDLAARVEVKQLLATADGVTSARYSSAATMTGGSNPEEIVGKIELYHPEWVWGYEDGIFKVSQVPVEYSNIRYSVTNKVDEVTNGNKADYYLRIVAKDGSDSNLPIEYHVFQYDTPGAKYPLESGIGYGPFELMADTENMQYYSVRVNWISSRPEHLAGIQEMKVQMIKKREGAQPRVIDEAPLHMKYTGETGMANVTFTYIADGQSNVTQTLNIPAGTTIDFTNAAQMEELGIAIPDGYSFEYATSELSGEDKVSRVTIPVPGEMGLRAQAADEDAPAERYQIQVHCLPKKPDKTVSPNNPETSDETVSPDNPETSDRTVTPNDPESADDKKTSDGTETEDKEDVSGNAKQSAETDGRQRESV